MRIVPNWVRFMKRKFGYTAGLVMLLTVLPACGPKSVQSTSDIVVTNSVLASIVQEVVGDAARVVSIVPDGKDPHEYEPSAGDIARITSAKLVVANGFGYEPTLEDAVASARADGVPVFDVERELPGLADNDPHWFTDPLMAVTVAEKLAPVLETALGVGLDESYSSAVAVLEAVADEGAKAIGALGSGAGTGPCTFGSEHVFLGPFSGRFGCPASAVLHAGSAGHDSEPSAAEIEDFVASIESNRVTVLVEDVSEPSKVLARVADQTGVRVVRVNVHAMGDAVAYRDYVMNIVGALVDGFE